MKKVFRKSIILLICAILALSACLCGCQKNVPGFPVALSAVDRSALELCMTAYTDAQLEEIYAYANESGSIKALNDKFPVECLRDKGDIYLVYYEGMKRVLVLRYDAKGNVIENKVLNCIHRMIDSRGKLDVIKNGDPISLVQTADPTCFFEFMLSDYEHVEGEEYYSDHYSDDGYHYRITYDRTTDPESGKAVYTVKTAEYEIM